MGLSLQEQLLKAGMVDKKQVKKSEHDKRMQRKKKKSGETASTQSAKAILQQQQAEQVKKDQELNAQRNQQAQRKADLAAVKQLIESNGQPLEEGEVAFHYVVDGKIKRISVSQPVADKLSNGMLGLAMCGEDFILLPADVVIKIMQRDQGTILAYNDPAGVDDDYPSDW